MHRPRKSSGKKSPCRSRELLSCWAGTTARRPESDPSMKTRRVPAPVCLPALNPPVLDQGQGVRGLLFLPAGRDIARPSPHGTRRSAPYAIPVDGERADAGDPPPGSGCASPSARSCAHCGQADRGLGSTNCRASASPRPPRRCPCPKALGSSTSTMPARPARAAAGDGPGGSRRTIPPPTCPPAPAPRPRCVLRARSFRQGWLIVPLDPMCSLLSCSLRGCAPAGRDGTASDGRGRCQFSRKARERESRMGFSRYCMKVRDAVSIITSAGMPGVGEKPRTRASSEAGRSTRAR